MVLKDSVGQTEKNCTFIEKNKKVIKILGLRNAVDDKGYKCKLLGLFVMKNLVDYGYFEVLN